MNPLYQFHDVVSRCRRIWKASGHDERDFDYVKLSAISRASTSSPHVDQSMWLEEITMYSKFHENPHYLFVGQKLSAFLDGMKFRDITPEHIQRAVELVPDFFVFSWGDGSSCLCRVTSKIREKSYKLPLLRALEQEMHCYFPVEEVAQVDWSAMIAIESPEKQYICGVPMTPLMLRTCPSCDFSACLDDDYAKHLPALSGLAELSNGESDILQCAFLRLAKTLVYVSAYPEQLKDGILGDCALAGLEPRHIKSASKTLTIKEEHRSVCSHLRCAYFRLYPLRRDGTRQNGLVFVRSAVVNGKSQTVVAKDGQGTED